MTKKSTMPTEGWAFLYNSPKWHYFDADGVGTTWGLLMPGAGRVDGQITVAGRLTNAPAEEEFMKAVNGDRQILRKETHQMINTDYTTDARNKGIHALNIDNLFTYHPPKGDQAERYHNIREIAKELALLMVKYCPPSTDTSAAIRLLRESVMTANSAIACNE